MLLDMWGNRAKDIEIGFESCFADGDFRLERTPKDYNFCMQNNRSGQKKEHSNTSKKPSGASYFAAFCLGGLGIYGLFHGANTIHNFGGFVIALLLIWAAIACISGGKK